PGATPAVAYPRKILEYMEGFLISKVVFSSCELGVFDLLLGAERPLSAEEISQAVGTSVDGTERLLAACAGLQLLNIHQDGGRLLYSNTESGQTFTMTRSSPLSLSLTVPEPSTLCWHYLTDAVREGRNQYEKAFGVDAKDLFQALYRSDEEMVKFMQLMNSIWNICGKEVVTAFDLSPFKTICDLGGSCSGALAKQCTSAYPECTVTIFDLPKVVRTSRENFFSEANRRIGFYEVGDFFKDPLPGADLYILARILHDWTDQRCIELLQRVHQACRPGGSVLLVEALLYEDGSGPLTAQLYSLNMLVQTEGRERSAAQYAALLTAAGFTSIQHRFTGKIYDAVLARK
uniref:Acetylserotonin O-methyltransferase n=1 Tax=Tetraodon nigroviridis TaxID=99883 RepID=H3DG83_TETNG